MPRGQIDTELNPTTLSAAVSSSVGLTATQLVSLVPDDLHHPRRRRRRRLSSDNDDNDDNDDEFRRRYTVVGKSNKRYSHHNREVSETADATKRRATMQALYDTMLTAGRVAPTGGGPWSHHAQQQQQRPPADEASTSTRPSPQTSSTPVLTRQPSLAGYDDIPAERQRDRLPPLVARSSALRASASQRRSTEEERLRESARRLDMAGFRNSRDMGWRLQSISLDPTDPHAVGVKLTLRNNSERSDSDAADGGVEEEKVFGDR
jgi:hypothetical protein